MNTPNSNTTSSVAAALKAAQAQSKAATSGDGSATVNTDTTGVTAGAQPPAAGKKGRKKTNAAATQPAKDPKVKVDDAWMATLTGKVNDKFAELLSTKNQYVAEHGAASINFAVAKNKGIPVSLTPRIIYANGAIQSPGPKGRLGFCTDQKFDEWFTKVEEKLVSAMERKPRLKGKVPAKSSFWTVIAEKLRVTLGETYSVRSTGGRLTIHEAPADATDVPVADWPLKAAFKQDGDKVVLSSAKGSVASVAPLLNQVLAAITE